MRSIKVAMTVAVLALAMAGCTDDETSGARTISGETAALADGTIRTWATFDENGALSTIGFTLPLAIVENLDAQTEVSLRYPEEVRAESFIDHLGLDFNPHGHGPEPYLLGHYDMHFYGIDPQTRAAINCADEPMPEDRYVPAPFIIPGTGMEPTGTCVPNMGVHAIDPTSPELDPESGETFSKTMILGYHGGMPIFFEPMITSDYLSQKMDFTMSIPAPESLGRSTLWPTRVIATFDEEQQTYYFEITDFVEAD